MKPLLFTPVAMGPLCSCTMQPGNVGGTLKISCAKRADFIQGFFCKLEHDTGNYHGKEEKDYNVKKYVLLHMGIKRLAQ